MSIKIIKAIIEIIKTIDFFSQAEAEKPFQNTELLIIATPWKMLKKINLKTYKKIKYIIDPYRQLTPSKIHKLCFKYIVMGKQ